MTPALGRMRQHVEREVAVLLEMERRAIAEPWKYVPWLPLQVAYMQSQSRHRLIRAGNQTIGKTHVALADLEATAEGRHPHRHYGRDKAGEYWIICESWAQSVTIQGKLHDLIPPDRLHPATEFSKARGFRGKHPLVRVRHETGEYSIIRIKTTNQGPAALASASIDGALFDEVPASERIYTEVAQRVEAAGGWISLAFTPINHPVQWIRDMVDSGLIEEHHAMLTPAQMIPVGRSTPLRLKDGTPCDEAWIAGKIARVPAHEVGVVVHGDWEVRVTDRYFSTFRSAGPDAHVHDRIPQGRSKLVIGIDHGDRPGKQCAVLLLIQDVPDSPYPSIYVLDEYADLEGTATPADDAMGILHMLGRHGWTWDNVDGAYGDRVHLRGQARQKSNKDLTAAIARHLRVPRDALRPIVKTVKRGAGRGKESVAIGSRWLFNALNRPGGLAIHPRCQRLIVSFDRYTMRDDEYKDPIDALRYGLDRYIFGGPRRVAASLYTR